MQNSRKKESTYLPIQTGHPGGRLGKNRMAEAVSTSTAPKQPASKTPNVQWKNDSYAKQSTRQENDSNVAF